MSKFKFSSDTRPLTSSEQRKYNLTKEELMDLKSLKNETWEPVDNSKSIFKEMQESVKTKQVSIRINVNDLKLIKEKANRVGLAYQTFIKSELHKIARRV